MPVKLRQAAIAAALFEVLPGEQPGLPVADVRALVGERVPPTASELAANNYLGAWTTGLRKAGWLEKVAGRWWATPEGRAAAAAFRDDPEAFYQEWNRLYHLWVADSTAGRVRLSDPVAAELSLRLAIWNELHDHGGPRNLERGMIRELGIYGGAQRVWVDAVRTRAIGGATGIAVGLLHTGRHYADDLSPNGILYHYPHTNRPAGRDASEVAATRRAAELALPVFVITPSERNTDRRDVHLGWVVDSDDASEIFLITFTDEVARPSAPTEQPTLPAPFALFDHDSEVRRVEVAARPNQQRFKFQVIARYGAACAVCDIATREVLDAVHIAEKGAHGSDHPENGLILCATHHRAYDAALFCIEPATLDIRISRSTDDLRMTRHSLTHLQAPPHTQALKWRWDHWPHRATFQST